MAFTTVITHATGDVFPAADWNTYIRDNINSIHSGMAGATTQILNGTVSYTAPAGSSGLYVEGVGGGGGSSGCAASGATTQLSLGPNGGSGAYSRKLLSANIGTHVVAVGAGGTAGGSGATSGGNGGDTTLNDSVGAIALTAKGGGGSSSGEVVAGGTGITFAVGGGAGLASGGVGDFKLDGTTTYHFRLGATFDLSNWAVSKLSPDIGVAGVRSGNVGSNGNVGLSYGGGATGAVDTNNTARSGAAGANGILIVRAFG